jgi:hypothetical protein
LEKGGEDSTYKEGARTSIKRWRFAIETKHNNALPIGVTFPACRLQQNRVAEVVFLESS